MPEEVVFQHKSELLTFEEIAQFVRLAAPLGIDKIRLTGGEPLLRRDLHHLVAQLVAIPGIHDVGLTTNGLLLAPQAAALYNAGLRRLNVSLDTLDPTRFHTLTRRQGLEQVIAGLLVAKRLGFAPIKVNAVAIRGMIEEDAVPLVRFCREHGFAMRFIEYMPIGSDPWERSKLVPAAELRARLEPTFGELVPVADADPLAPAAEYQLADGTPVGFIASVSQPFCTRCNRLRLTADGKLRNCLFALDEVDVKSLLRRANSAEQIQALIRQNVWDKWAGHEINSVHFVKPDRTMHAIGG